MLAFKPHAALQRGPKPLAILRHVHELRGNENEFDYNGRRYCWNWHRFLGGQHTLTDMDSKEVVAVGKLHFTFAWQWVTAWGFRWVPWISDPGLS